MQWYTGTIAEAIQKSKAAKSVFVVYLEGEDDISKQMTETWNTEAVKKVCDDANFVAIRLVANSESCKQFGQIYPIVCIPSSFFIALSGVPLEIIGGHVTQDILIQKIKKVLELHESSLGANKPASSNSDPSSSESLPPVTNDERANQSGDQENAAIAPGDASQSELPASSPDGLSLDEKVQRAQQLIEEKRLRKLQQEKEEQKRRELERRQLGKDVQKLKMSQQEQEARKIKEEQRREKMEERAARERVKQQIAQDRAEKAARYSREMQEREAEIHAAKARKLQEQQAEAQAKAAAASTKARIQFRLPDGSFITQSFDADQLFQQALNFISERVGNKYGNFTLKTTFPVRVYGPPDASTSLRDLQLAPTAVLLVIPGAHRGLLPRSDSGSNFLWTLLLPLITLFNWLRAFVLGTSSSATQTTEGQLSHSQTVENQSSSEQNRLPPAAYSSYREGNITRLRNRQDDKDDNTTWNGNSTQQM